MSVDEQNCAGVSTVDVFIQHITTADWHVTIKGTVLLDNRYHAHHSKGHSRTRQQLSCTPHKDSAGALYS